MPKTRYAYKWFSTLTLDRLLITDNDLIMAARFLDEYLGRRLYEQRPETSVASDAFTVAIVVTYARPFTQRKNRAGTNESTQTAAFLAEDLPAPDIHSSALSDRHSWLAHSDAQPRDATPGTMFDIPPLGEREVRGLYQNILAIRERLKPYVDQLHQ